jgi:septum formation protein
MFAAEPPTSRVRVESPRLVLASQSPRRAELLGRLGLTFDVLPAMVDETYPPAEPPSQHAERLAREKSQAVSTLHPDAIVIGSDTIVVVDGDVLGKPRDEAEARQMLTRLAGRRHQVHTGVALSTNGQTRSAVEIADVLFRHLDQIEIERYVETGEPLDKAGAYGIQGYGSALVESINGDYFAVMGLPIVRLLDLFRQAGWRYVFRQGFVPAWPAHTSTSSHGKGANG